VRWKKRKEKHAYCHFWREWPNRTHLDETSTGCGPYGGRGHSSPGGIPPHHERLRVVHGDVLDLASVEQAVAGQNAVLSAIGAPFSRKPITVYSQGTANMIQAMNHHGIRRLVVVSSGATNLHPDPREGFLFRRIIKPIVGRTLYADMSLMEALVRESDLDWTIIQPARLFDTPTVTH
jgi:putative NADH-flavin reductase